MNKATILAAASAAALLSTIPAFAQANQQGNGFVTLDLNWTETGAPAESQMDGDRMRQILERDQARVKWIQERTKAKAPAIKPELVNAHEIILKCAGQEVPASEAEPENAKTAETEASAENKEEIKKEPSRVSKISIIILAAGIILCVIGVISLVLSLKG